jgi:hypothetical protein
VFGKDLLNSVSFEAKYEFDWKLGKSQKPPVTGVILAAIYAGRSDYNTGLPHAWMHLFEVRAETFSEHVGHRLVTIMRDVMKPWTESRLASFENDPVRFATLLAEYNSSGIVLYELQYLNRKTEFIEIPTG